MYINRKTLKIVLSKTTGPICKQVGVNGHWVAIYQLCDRLKNVDARGVPPVFPMYSMQCTRVSPLAIYKRVWMWGVGGLVITIHKKFSPLFISLKK